MRYLVSWTLFLIGDAAFRLMEALGGLYQAAMRASHDTQGDSTRGPWGESQSGHRKHDEVRLGDE